jgi:hypothetical protein
MTKKKKKKLHCCQSPLSVSDGPRCVLTRQQTYISFFLGTMDEKHICIAFFAHTYIYKQYLKNKNILVFFAKTIAS